jgi:filamentous hemagglutinin family protein
MKSHASMNRVYRLVWNAALNIWVAVAENAKGQGKGGSARTGVAVSGLASGRFSLNPACRAAAVLFGAVLQFAAPAAQAADAANAAVTAGAGSVSTLGATTTINQASARLAIDWTSLSTKANESLRFVQPNAQAIALNRIIGSSPSEFLGSLSANGQVFILNPNGVLFGAGAQVNVGGLVAATLNMSNADFMAGRNVFTNDAGGKASVINRGTLTAAPGGYLALLAPEVRNEGVMSATLGTALLAAGNKVTLTLNNGSLLGYSIDQGAIDALAENSQLIEAGGGRVILSARAADALGAAVVNNTGVIEARSMTRGGGQILLDGDFVSQTGTLDASGVSGGRIAINARGILDAGVANASGGTGDGGRISYNATQAIVQTAAAVLTVDAGAAGGTIDLQGGNNFFSSGSLSARGDTGGSITALASNVTLAAATLDASGATRGGAIRVGGDFHGASAGAANAQTTYVNGATTLKADGGLGTVVVWSDQKTDFYGSIRANNAAAEVSSKGTLTYGGQASLGAAGSLLLDPANIIITDSAGPAAFALIDPNSAANNYFAGTTALLGTGVYINKNNNNSESLASLPVSKDQASTFKENGKIVVTSSGDSLGGANAGAVYVFDTTTGALVSSLNGTHANDGVGNNGIITLTNGNFLVSSRYWDSRKGAVTFGSGTTGVSGAVSAANSLVGSTAGDYVGNNGVVQLANGNYLVSTVRWGDQKGAVTFGSGTTGVRGVVSADNSLVGSTSRDYVGGNGITELANGNYVVASGNWDNLKGAVTFGSGMTGVSGVVSAANSLVGSTSGDYVGNDGVAALANGNYVVASSGWDTQKGAVTFGSGTTGVSGVVSAANSLVGSTSGTPYNYYGSTSYYGGDQVGSNGIVKLANGNYVVNSYTWNLNQGAVTFGSGTSGVSGVVSAGNSLVGTTQGQLNQSFDPSTIYSYYYIIGGDQLGNYGITALTNGNYVVRSGDWNSQKGAVTFGNGTTGVRGAVSAANSLVGSASGDYVGNDDLVVLANSNYLVRSSNWSNQRGAVTFGSAATGVSGMVSADNSLVGSNADDLVGNNGITQLANGNYLVNSANWDSGKGAVTFGSGTTGVKGAVSAGNSLVGAASGDSVGNNGITELANGNYVVASGNWDSQKGAVTFGSGMSGVSGVVSAANSLVGSAQGDYVGDDQIVALTNGNYVVRSGNWGGQKGAVTFGNGATGVSGVVSDANSLVGSTQNDAVGSNGITALANGNYVVSSSSWDNHKGAVTFGNGTTGVSGVVSAANSLVGSSSGASFSYYGSTYSYGADEVGSYGIVELANGNYVVRSSGWSLNRGAVTFGSGTSGVKGEVSSANSLVGSTQGEVNPAFDSSTTTTYYSIRGGDQIGGSGVSTLSNGNYVVRSAQWGGQKGAVTFGNGTTGVSGVVSAANSLVGSTSGTAFNYRGNTYYYGADQLGGNDIVELAGGNYVVSSANWNLNQGAVTFGSGTTGVKGEISSSNSLVGTTKGELNTPINPSSTRTYYSIVGGDQVGGDGVIALANGNYVVGSSSFASGAGQVLIGTPGDVSYLTGSASGSTMSFNPSALSATLAGGTAVTLQASNDVTVNANITVLGSGGGAFTLQAGRSINLNSIITTANGNFTAVAGDPGAVAADRMPGVATVTLGAGAAIHAGTGQVTLAAVNGNFVNNSGSATPVTASRYFVYSSQPALDTRGGLTAGHVGNAQGYTGTTPAYASSGNWFFYSGTPADVPVVPAATGPVPLALAAAYASALDDMARTDNEPQDRHHPGKPKGDRNPAGTAPVTPLVSIVNCGVSTPGDVKPADCN